MVRLRFKRLVGDRDAGIERHRLDDIFIGDLFVRDRIYRQPPATRRRRRWASERTATLKILRHPTTAWRCISNGRPLSHRASSLQILGHDRPNSRAIISAFRIGMLTREFVLE
jgi:hypothetical protein